MRLSKDRKKIRLKLNVMPWSRRDWTKCSSGKAADSHGMGRMEFMRKKIRGRVKNLEVAEKLIPKDHGFGIRPVPVETNSDSG